MDTRCINQLKEPLAKYNASHVDFAENSEAREDEALVFPFLLNLHHMFSRGRKNKLFFGLVTHNFHLNHETVSAWFSQPLLLYPKSAAASHTHLGLWDETFIQSLISCLCSLHQQGFTRPSVLTFDALKLRVCPLRCSSKTKSRQPKSLPGSRCRLSQNSSVIVKNTLQDKTHAWY